MKYYYNYLYCTYTYILTFACDSDYVYIGYRGKKWPM